MDNSFDELLELICPLDILNNNENQIEIIVEPFDTNESEGGYISVTKATLETLPISNCKSHISSRTVKT